VKAGRHGEKQIRQSTRNSHFVGPVGNFHQRPVEIKK